MAEKIWKVKCKIRPKGKNWLLKILSQNRDLNSAKLLHDFLNPTLGQILDVKLTELDKGVERVIQGIKKGEKIIVYSDYDCDGISATAILWETLHDLGASVMPYVPHRIKEGYGLSKPAISNLAKEGVNLIVTVDHGVTAVAQVEHAKSLGIDVVITDHHVLPEKLPASVALVHSTALCGAGVSWRFAWEIVKKFQPGYEKTLLEKLELASLATICDLMPLLGANRAVVKLGLEELVKTKRPGIIALMQASGLSGPIGTFEMGHILGPRINAMGRIGHGLDSLRLLCAKNQAQAENLAKTLSKTNSLRKDLTTKAVTHATSLVTEDMAIGVLAHPEWHEGVIGLVASRLVETFNRPMIVISKGQTYSKGSARSIKGFNIVEAIRASSEFLVDGGGHPMAAGFTIETRHIEAFTAKINAHAKTLITEELLEPVIEAECELLAEDINKEISGQIKVFEPFGIANPEPIFLTKNMLVEDVRTVGANSEHLKLQVSGLSAIGFNLGSHRANIRPGYLIDLIYTIVEDRYNGGIQLKLKDLRISN